MSSILTDTKKVLGIAPDDPSFDLDVALQINAAFSTLSDLGAGPEAGFAIDDETKEWTDYLDPGEDPELQIVLSKVKNYVYLKTRLIFDPPASQFVMNALQEQIKELEWRINVNRETTKWVDPTPTDTDVLVVDGGDPSGG
jgi:hypothetical protein